MLSTLLAISWQPEIRGAVVVIVMAIVLIGGSYLVVGTNVGARLGFLIVMSALFGWMTVMAAVWWTYGIGLKGPEPSWKPADPVTIIRDSSLLTAAGILESSAGTGATPTEAAKNASEQFQKEGWKLLDEADPQRGQAIAASDAILQIEAEEFAAGEYLNVAVYDRGGERYPKINDSLDFFAFFHKPHYAIVEIALIKPQLSEPGRAPATPVIDSTQPHRYVVMLRDLGSRRQPAAFITLGSGLIFGVLCMMLHRRDQVVALNRSAVPAKV